MEMENKHYTPEIDEFHIGFECEFFNNLTDKVWSKEVCDEDLINIAFSINEHGNVDFDESEGFDKCFRVKYLDREDIESEGWKKYSSVIDKSLYNRFFIGEFEIRMIDGKFITDKDKNRITILSANPLKHYGLGGVVFIGTIKNLSEFRKLQQQLGIK